MNKKPDNEKAIGKPDEQLVNKNYILEGSIQPRGCGGLLYKKDSADHVLPDWEMWLDIPEVKLWQACALSLNIEPDSIAPSNDGMGMGMGGESFFRSEKFLRQEIWDKFNKRCRLLDATGRHHRPLYHSISLQDFVNLTLRFSYPWDMPIELLELAQRREAQTSTPKNESVKDDEDIENNEKDKSNTLKAAWMIIARDMADNICRSQRKLGCDPSLQVIADLTAIELEKKILKPTKTRELPVNI